MAARAHSTAAPRALARIDADILPPLSLAQACSLSTLIAVADGLLCQPRFEGVQNPASIILDDLNDRMARLRESAASQIAAAQPVDAIERTSRASILLQRAAEESDDIGDMMGAVLSITATRN